MTTRNVTNHIEMGISYFGKKELTKSLEHFLEHLKLHPKDKIANKAVGAIFFQQKEYKKALNYLLKANTLTPDDVEVINLLGASYMETNSFIEAHDYFNAAIEKKPDYIDAIYNLGLLYFKTNNYTTAINAFSHILTIKNNHENATIYKGISLERCEKYQQALEVLLPLLPNFISNTNVVFSIANCYIKLNDIKHLSNIIEQVENEVILFNLANFLLEHNLSDKSIEIYNRLYKTYPDKASLLNNIASAYDNLDQVEKSIEYFKKCIKEYPEFTPAYINIGRVLGDIKQPDEAIHYLNLGLSLDSHNTNAYINLGRAHEIKREYDEAYKCYAKAQDLEPNNASVLYNLGNINQHKGQYSSAIKHYKECLAISPDHFDAEFNLAITELTIGDFANAWGHYFKRYRTLRDDESLSTIIPGTDYRNKTIYLRYNQGLGDELLFLRFLPALKRFETHITYRCQNKLYELLKNNPYIDCLIDETATTPKADFYFSVDDLPLILGMNKVEQIPPAIQLSTSDTNYLDKLTSKFHDYPRPYLGITWRAGIQEEKINYKLKQNSLNKFFSLESMIDVLQDFKGTLFILQRNPTKNEIQKLNYAFPNRIIDSSDYNEDLIKITELLDFIDDSICVSNTNVHISAGINKTCNVIVPYPPEWRWMDTTCNSPWFPYMETFRQASDGNWENALKRLKLKVKTMYGHDNS